MKVIRRKNKDHIGQVEIENADKHIDRLNNEYQTYIKDYSKFLYNEDHRHIPLQEGNCWVVKKSVDYD